jgi:hypothetical protein
MARSPPLGNVAKGKAALAFSFMAAGRRNAAREQARSVGRKGQDGSGICRAKFSRKHAPMVEDHGEIGKPLSRIKVSSLFPTRRYIRGKRYHRI